MNAHTRDKQLECGSVTIDQASFCAYCNLDSMSRFDIIWFRLQYETQAYLKLASNVSFIAGVADVLSDGINYMMLVSRHHRLMVFKVKSVLANIFVLGYDSCRPRRKHMGWVERIIVRIRIMKGH